MKSRYSPFSKARHWTVVGLVILLLPVFAAAHAAPCDGLNRHRADESQTTLSRSIAAQMQVGKIDLLQSFREGGWQILYVAPDAADEAFLFYSSDPEKSHYVTLWGGAAGPSEEASIRSWATTNAPGIPDRLAGCFAWFVTHDRK